MGCGASANAPHDGASESAFDARGGSPLGCVGPDEALIKSVAVPAPTGATRGPRAKGIHIVPSQRCKSQLLFVAGARADRVQAAAVEVRNFESAADLGAEWYSAGGFGPRGVYYIANVAERGTVVSLTPGKYMFRWNAGGIRCRAPETSPKLCENMSKASSREVVMAYFDSAQSAGGNAESVVYLDAPNGKELLKADLAALKTCRSPRYLSNNMQSYKSLLIDIEDSILYNLFEFNLRICMDAGHFERGHYASRRQPAAELSPPRKKLQQQRSERFVQECIDHVAALVAQTGMKRGAVLPKVQKEYASIVANQTCLEMPPPSAKGKPTGDAKDAPNPSLPTHGLHNPHHHPMPPQQRLIGHHHPRHHPHLGPSSALFLPPPPPPLALKTPQRDNNPELIKKRVEETFEASYATASPTAPILVPQDVYHVDVYIVLPKGAENTYMLPYVHIWEEGSDRVSKCLMKPYYLGDPPDDDSAFSSNSNSEDGSVENLSVFSEDKPQAPVSENLSSQGSEDESDDDDTYYHWRGFFATVAVAPNVTYCYRVVIDGVLFLSATNTTTASKRYFKKFSVSPCVGSWQLPESA